MPRSFFATCLALLLLGRLFAADERPFTVSPEWVAEHYTKYEHMIPMRDGVKLYTRVYVPKDDSTTWPIVLSRTPYAAKPYGPDNYSKLDGTFGRLAKDKFILVLQDVRGRFGSEGTFEHVRPFNPAKGPREADESTDAWDTIEWLLQHVPRHNGRVGMVGISYPGYYTSMGMISGHPALKAASPQAPIADWFLGDDAHHNGAFFLSQNFGFTAWFDTKVGDPLHETIPNYNFPTTDAYDFFLRMGPLGNSDTQLLKGRSPFWTQMLAHPNYDEFWKARDIRPHLKNIRCAVLTVGGWYDGEDFWGTLQTYHRVEQQNPGITNTLVIGPWFHGGWARDDGERLGDVSFRAKTSLYYLEQVELPFFRHYLKGAEAAPLPEALMFETGSNQWRRFDAWPPKNVRERTLYLAPGGKLSASAPADAATAFDEFVSDPAKPVPYTLKRSTSYPRSYLTEDQSFATSRPDVLVYETDVLTEDLALAGPIEVTLHVSTTGTDADWVVKVIDVYAGDTTDPTPNPTGVVMSGYQQLVRAEVMRGRFRNSFEKPEPFTPGERTKVSFTLPDVLHTFRRGHRLLVHVQSSWFPLVDRNPQTFVDIAKAKPEDFKKATHRVYRIPEAASALKVSVLKE